MRINTLLQPVLLIAFFLVGCGAATTRVTHTGPSAPSRGDRCDFEVVEAAPPATEWFEIATVDAWAGDYSTLASFREAIELQVCRSGGELVVAMKRGDGGYVKANVFRHGTPDNPTPVASPVAHTFDDDAPSTGGCRYDTQCKGDRICVKGECVGPSQK